MFQSRNRGSFDFKRSRMRPRKAMNLSFNLVIEVLLISREIHVIEISDLALMFQSRNRGSFDFKGLRMRTLADTDLEFQSRNRGSFDFK